MGQKLHNIIYLHYCYVYHYLSHYDYDYNILKTFNKHTHLAMHRLKHEFDLLSLVIAASRQNVNDRLLISS